ncbi:hypothetical protein O9992_12995 [Vibrio lentus]|nr:hypothetical protein [Vibrio lentus]
MKKAEKKQLIWYLPVIAAILVVSVLYGPFSVISAMQGKGRYYVTKIEKVILKLETNNQRWLYLLIAVVGDVVKQLRYGNYLMRQLVVVKWLCYLFI